MKKYLLWCACLMLSAQLYAQTDSVAFAHAAWTSKKVAGNVTWKSTWFANHNLFGANQSINVLELKPPFKKAKLIVAYSDSLEGTSQMSKKYNAIAGINGSFFKMRGADPDNHPELNGVPKLEPSKLSYNRSGVYLRNDGKLITKNKTTANQTVRKRAQQGTVAITDKAVNILQPDSLNFNWEDKIKARDVITSGPLMLIQGQDLPIANDKFCMGRNPRTAVGKKPDGTIILLVVDGRFEQSAGMSIPELQKTMRWLGCTDAINLDGGGSSTMYIKNQGVVNYPSDNKKFDHAGEREVANALLIVGDK